MNNEELTIDGLRKLADFLEAHPQPYLPSVTVNIPCDNKEELLRLVETAPESFSQGLHRATSRNLYVHTSSTPSSDAGAAGNAPQSSGRSG